MGTMDLAADATRMKLEAVITASMFVGGMAWAAHVAVAAWSLWTIFRKRDQQALRWVWPVCALFTFASMHIFGYYDYYVLAFIKERSWPGGPLTFWAENMNERSSIYAFGGGLTTFVLGYVFLARQIYSLYPSSWFVRIGTGFIFITACVTGGEDVHLFIKIIASPPTWEDVLAAPNILLLGFYRNLPFFILTCIGVVVRGLHGASVAIKDMEPSRKAVAYQYTAIAVSTVPMCILSFLDIVIGVFGLFKKDLRPVQFAFTVVGVQLMAICVELLITWTVQPPQEIQDALRDADVDREESGLVHV